MVSLTCTIKPTVSL